MPPAPAARFPFPIPTGWSAVAWSEELGPGDVRSASATCAPAGSPTWRSSCSRRRSTPSTSTCAGSSRCRRRRKGAPSPVGVAFAREFVRQFHQDIAIWEAKQYLPRPVLCDGDGAIGSFRRWARQFYAEPPG